MPSTTTKTNGRGCRSRYAVPGSNVKAASLVEANALLQRSVSATLIATSSPHRIGHGHSGSGGSIFSPPRVSSTPPPAVPMVASPSLPNHQHEAATPSPRARARLSLPPLVASPVPHGDGGGGSAPPRSMPRTRRNRAPAMLPSLKDTTTDRDDGATTSMDAYGGSAEEEEPAPRRAGAGPAAAFLTAAADSGNNSPAAAAATNQHQQQRQRKNATGSSAAPLVQWLVPAMAKGQEGLQQPRPSAETEEDVSRVHRRSVALQLASSIKVQQQTERLLERTHGDIDAASRQSRADGLQAVVHRAPASMLAKDRDGPSLLSSIPETAYDEASVRRETRQRRQLQQQQQQQQQQQRCSNGTRPRSPMSSPARRATASGANNGGTVSTAMAATVTISAPPEAADTEDLSHDDDGGSDDDDARIEASQSALHHLQSLMPKCATRPKNWAQPVALMRKVRDTADDLERRFYGETERDRKERLRLELIEIANRPPTPPLQRMKNGFDAVATVPDDTLQAYADHLVAFARRHRATIDAERHAALALISQRSRVSPHFTFADYAVLRARFDALLDSPEHTTLLIRTMPTKGLRFAQHTVDAAGIRHLRTAVGTARRKRIGFVDVLEIIYGGYAHTVKADHHHSNGNGGPGSPTLSAVAGGGSSSPIHHHLAASTSSVSMAATRRRSSATMASTLAAPGSLTRGEIAARARVHQAEYDEKARHHHLTMAADALPNPELMSVARAFMLEDTGRRGWITLEQFMRLARPGDMVSVEDVVATFNANSRQMTQEDSTGSNSVASPRKLSVGQLLAASRESLTPTTGTTPRHDTAPGGGASGSTLFADVVRRAREAAGTWKASTADRVQQRRRASTVAFVSDGSAAAPPPPLVPPTAAASSSPPPLPVAPAAVSTPLGASPSSKRNVDAAAMMETSLDSQGGDSEAPRGGGGDEASSSPPLPPPPPSWVLQQHQQPPRQAERIMDIEQFVLATRPGALLRASPAASAPFDADAGPHRCDL